MHAHLSVKLESVIDIPLLKSIIEQCDYTYKGQIFICSDVIFGQHKVVVLLKWSKTMQSNNGIKLIHVLKIHNSAICPVAALFNLLIYFSFNTKYFKTGFL